MNKDEIYHRLNQQPDDWQARQELVNILIQDGQNHTAEVHQWLIDNQKYPGPACVMEAAWHEATWFHESKANTGWGFPDPHQYYSRQNIRTNWCLPDKVYKELKGFITKDRRDPGVNKHAKSWNGRQDAEDALVLAACGTASRILPPKKLKPRTLDSPWNQDEFE